MSGARKYTTITPVEWNCHLPRIGGRMRKDFEGGYQIEIYSLPSPSRSRSYGAILSHNDHILHCDDYPSTGRAKADCKNRMEAHRQAATTVPIVQARPRTAA